MNTPPLANGPGTLNGPGNQTTPPRHETSPPVTRPRVDVLKRQRETAVERSRLRYLDRPTADKKTRDEIVKRFLGATERLKLMEKYDLIYKYQPISATEVRLLYLNPALRYEDDIFVDIASIEDKKTGPGDSQQPYEALSYHWGSGPADKPVYLYGKWSNAKVDVADIFSLRRAVPDFAKGQRLYVRPNLDKALRSLRDQAHMVILWVDAICINQPDEKVEKPAQIAKMKHIYNKADNVCIWLGDGKGDRGNEDRSKDFYAAMSFSRTILDLGRFEEFLHEKHTKEWSDLLDLMRFSWFSRRWVIQELALAREATVHCGTECVSWQDFADAIGLFVLNFDKIRTLFGQSKDVNIFRNFENFNELEPLGAKVLVDAITNTFRKNADGTVFEPVFNLETLASSLASFESSDPRDSIFALLNIASESMLPSSGESDIVLPPKPNYERNLLDVYTDLLEWVVHSTSSLDMMCRHWATPERTKPGGRKNPTPLVTLPSWIQTIQRSTWGTLEQGLNGRINGDSLVGKAGRRRYNASHGTIPQVRFGERRRVLGLRTNSAPVSSGYVKPVNTSPKTAFFPTSNTSLPPNITPSHILHVKGIVIGSIKWASSPVARGVVTRACFQKGGWSFDDEQPKHKVPDKLWRTMVADRDADGNNTPPWYHRAALHAMALVDNNGDLATQELRDKGDMVGRRQPQIVIEFLKRVQAVTWNRKFIEGRPDSPTASEAEPLFGISSPETESGDLICILFGCSVPCILRNYGVGNSGRYLKFIGEAYVYGRMDGEGISMLSAEELKEKTVGFVIV